MTAVKVWVPNELLKSTDLNTAFGTVAQGFMPGMMGGGGAPVTIAAGASAELPGVAPAPANDQGGYWNSGTSRVVIPTGLGGLYLVHTVVTTTGGTKGDFGHSVVTGGNQGGASYFARPGGAGQYSFHTAYVASLAAGAVLYVTGSLLTTGGDMTLSTFRLARLASFGVFA